MYPNDGHFVQKTYTNEVYSVHGARQQNLRPSERPVTYLIVTGNLTRVRRRHELSLPIPASSPECRSTTFKGLFPQGTTVVIRRRQQSRHDEPARERHAERRRVRNQRPY